MRKLLWIGSGLLCVGVGLGACGVSTDSVCDYPGACGGDAGADGMLDGSGDMGIDAPVGCDLTKEPKDSIACVADSVGMFVDATKGDDTAGDGSKAKPMKTIGKALEKVGNKPRIYVCEGTYAEDVVLDASHDGVSLYGGWKCADWSYSGGKPVVGKGTLALKVDSAKSAIVIADLDVKSANAVNPGGSSIAAFVNASDKVSFLRAKLEAGAGKAGDSGTLTAFTYPVQAALDGKDASGATGGAANPVTCPGGKVTTGGKGGDGSGGDGDMGLPANGGGTKGLGGAQSVACTAGGDGVAGKAGKDGDKVSGLGTMVSSGWQSAGGASGVAGEPGQGGGGGGGRTFNAVSGGGGGGGAGGCGGAAGGGGTGGGGSIALASLSSTVTVAGSELVATTGGDGGNGLAGQAGQTISGFGGNKAASGCSGGTGATGGNGGAGGGGAGGISVGILWKGAAAPTIDSSTTAKITVAAKGGAKGLGGATPTNDGIDGVAQAVLEVK